METPILPSKYDGKHALNCLEQEIRQMQGGKITCKQKGKILIIEKELKALEIIKKYNVRPSDYHYNTTYNIYLCNMSFAPDDEIMSEEEYNLLKEVLL